MGFQLYILFVFLWVMYIDDAYNIIITISLKAAWVVAKW